MVGIYSSRPADLQISDLPTDDHTSTGTVETSTSPSSPVATVIPYPNLSTPRSRMLTFPSPSQFALSTLHSSHSCPTPAAGGIRWLTSKLALFRIFFAPFRTAPAQREKKAGYTSITGQRAKRILIIPMPSRLGDHLAADVAQGSLCIVYRRL